MNHDLQDFTNAFLHGKTDIADTFQGMAKMVEDTYFLIFQLLSSMPGSFMLIDPDGKVMAASVKMMKQFLQQKNVKGMHYSKLTYPIFNEKSKDQLITNLIRQAIAKKINLEKVLIESKNSSNNDPILVEFNLHILYRSANEPIGVLVNLVENVVRHNMLPGNLEKDQKLKKLGSLSAGLVHEIKNPLQSLNSISQVLQHKYPNDEYIQESMNSSMTENHRISTILSEYLTFSGNNQDYMCQTHINEICHDVLKIIHGNCFMNDIQLVEDLADDMPNMVLDIGRMKQVIVNLVTNSIDAINTLRYTDDFDKTHPNHQGVITVSTKYDYDQNECYLKVTDNGIGMTEETLQNISRPFYTTKKYGTGIGVSICKNILKNHGGRLQIESEYGKGSTFTVILPELAGQMEKIVRKKMTDQPDGITITRGGQYRKDDYINT